MSDEKQPTVFERAARVFDGSDDPQTGLRVLRVATSDREVCPLVAAGGTWTTLYHQCRCFLDGGRRAFLYGYPLRGSAPTDPKRRRVGQFLIDLTTGEVAQPLPPTCWVTDASDAGQTASLSFRQETEREAVFWDLNRNQPLCSLRVPGWSLTTSTLLADGRRMLAGFHTGPWRKGRCHSQHYLLHADGRTEQVLDADGYFCNHAVGCPADPDLYAYDRWPTPDRAVDVVIHIRKADGSFETPLPLLDSTVRPGPMMECSRDHYVWTPDGKRVASYLLPQAEDFTTNHYTYRWWISVTDWRTGEDLCVPYPPERWGGHPQAAPDSRHLVTCGGQRFDYLYAIEIEGLRRGWNERILCRYPPSPPDQYGLSVNHHPHVLPDMSGVLFTAGLGGPEEGVYLVEWPRDL